MRLFNLTMTNVPASPKSLYAFGAQLREVLPLVPLLARHPVGIAAHRANAHVESSASRPSITSTPDPVAPIAGMTRPEL